MPIKFKYDLAAVPATSNQTTRRFGQSLVEQQRQQNFAKQQLGQQLGARDFQNATSNMSSYLKDMLDNGEITDEPTRRRLLALRSGVDTVMGSSFTDDQRRHYLNQYNSQIAGILANAPVKAKPTRDDELKGFLGSNYDKYKDQPWVPDGKGGFSIADIPQPEQPKLPEPKPQPPKSFREYYDKDPQGAAKAFADKVAEIRLSMDEGEPLGPWKSAEERAFAELEAPYKAMQGRYSQPTQAPPSAGALPAPTTGASMGTGGPQGNSWAGVASQDDQSFTYSSTPDVGSFRESATATGRPVVPAWREEMKGQVSPGVDRSGTGAVAQNNYNAKLDAMRTPMTPEQIAVLDAQTNATMDSTNAQLAENQARADEVQAGYAPRTNSLKRQADAMSNKTDRAESALRGELLPRSPQGERPSSMYDISDAKDKREAEQYAANQAEYGKYKAKRAEGDDALHNPTEPNVNAIADPETMKQAARKFSSDYQIYKRGGGTLSTRDYIRQRVAQNTGHDDMSPDLIRQLENMYGMDLTSQQYVDKQDIQAPRTQAMADAKAKRDSEANRRKYARGMPVAQQMPAPAAASKVVPAAATPLQVPSSRIPPAFGTVDPVTGQQFQRGAKYPEVLPPAPATPEAVPGQQAAPTTAAPALPQAPKPDFESIANAADEDDRALIVKLQPIYDSQSPDVQNAINVVFGESSLDEDVARALAYLNSKGILDDQLTAPSVPPPVGRRGNPGTTPPKPANKGGMGPFPKPTGGRRGKQY